MEPKEDVPSGGTVIAAGNPSSYHMVPRTEGSLAPGATPTVYAPVGLGSTGSSEKKKRGRPRKYGAEGASTRPLSPMPISASSASAAGNFSVQKGERSSEKKHRNKAGTENLGELVSCSTGINFLPHMITVNAGEDVTMKIIAFSQNGPRAVCIISAVGLVSNVTLRHPNSSGGTLTYEGRFEILSLAGSFTPTEIGGSLVSRCGGMSISLASPDGRVVGGTLAGLLIAASPVQVIVGSFLPSNQNDPRPRRQKQETKLIANPGAPVAVPRAPNVDHGNLNTQGVNNSQARYADMMAPSSAGQTNNWSSMAALDNRSKQTTDINMPLQGE